MATQRSQRALPGEEGVRSLMTRFEGRPLCARAPRNQMLRKDGAIGAAIGDLLSAEARELYALHFAPLFPIRTES